MYKKFQWAVVDKSSSNKLIEVSRKYNDGLFNVLPEPHQSFGAGSMIVGGQVRRLGGVKSQSFSKRYVTSALTGICRPIHRCFGLMPPATRP